MTTVSAIGALVALIVAIFLILKKVSPAYGMLVGALVGGLIGGCGFIANSEPNDRWRTGYLLLRLCVSLAAGVLAGVLIESGAANSITETITNKLGETRALLALALATMIFNCGGCVRGCGSDYCFTNCFSVIASQRFIESCNFARHDWRW
ncbi:gluconate:H+ symporter family protein [Haemophilus influenzae]|uniref:Gluconate:H+ symporter family protein n=1 Tax=Haemophilus influenzae TaxID=727 RepID=A0A2X1PLV0_HAEIF|nr:gluconate:H+ symporter family protein [Haemophilus influenzae]